MSSSRFSTTIGASVNGLLLPLLGELIVLYAKNLVYALIDNWRVVAGLAVVALVFSSLSKALLPGRLEETPGVGVANPFGVEAAREVLELLGTIGFFLLPSAVRALYQQLMDGWNQGSRLIHRST
jgi:hypothetical protein